MDEDTAAEIMECLVAVDYAIATVNQPGLTEMWIELVNKIREGKALIPCCPVIVLVYCGIRIFLDTRKRPKR